MILCFSATASFTAAVATGGLGIANFKYAPSKLTWPLAAIPFLFGLQQAVEGFLWLSFQQTISTGWNPPLTFIYSLFSHALWPTFVPLSIWLIETNQTRKQILKYIFGLGFLLSSFLLYYMIFWPVTSEIINGHIRYNYHHHLPRLSMVLYLVAVCASCFVSSRAVIRYFGLALAISFGVAFIAFRLTFFSVWCFFAAILSLMLFKYFQHQTSPTKPV